MGYHNIYLMQYKVYILLFISFLMRQCVLFSGITILALLAMLTLPFPSVAIINP